MSNRVKTLKFILLCLIYIVLVFALANPQLGASVEKGKRKGIDVMFCLDVSNSMLAQDLSPNRLEAAKRAMLSFIDKLKGDRIGLVVFAGKAFVQLPITSDYAAAKLLSVMYLRNLLTHKALISARQLTWQQVLCLPIKKPIKHLKNQQPIR